MAAITQGETIVRILEHLGLESVAAQRGFAEAVRIAYPQRWLIH
jgi:hypothetical protein